MGDSDFCGEPRYRGALLESRKCLTEGEKKAVGAVLEMRTIAGLAYRKKDMQLGGWYLEDFSLIMPRCI